MKSAAQDESWNLGEISFDGKQHSSRRRSPVDDTLPQFDPEYQSPQDEPREGLNEDPGIITMSSLVSTAPPQAAIAEYEAEPPNTTKRRGRKKKVVQMVEVTIEPEKSRVKVDNTDGQSGVPGEQAWKKRGRPRKSIERPQEKTAAERGDVQVKAVASDTDPKEEPRREDQTPGSEPEPATPGRASRTDRGKGKKIATKATQAQDLPSSAARSRALSDRTNLQTSQPPSPSSKPNLLAGDAKDNRKSATEGELKKTVKDTKLDVNSTGQGKVGYRVGLSKRSRIAPLLKMIRK